MTHGSIRSRDFHYVVIGEGTSPRQPHIAPLPAPHVRWAAGVIEHRVLCFVHLH